MSSAKCQDPEILVTQAPLVKLRGPATFLPSPPVGLPKYETTPDLLIQHSGPEYLKPLQSAVSAVIVHVSDSCRCQLGIFDRPRALERGF